MDRGPLWATVHRVAKNWTWLSDWALTHMQSMVLSIRKVEELVQSRALFSWTYFPTEASTQINTISSNDDDHSNEINSMVEWVVYFRQHGWRSHLREVTFRVEVWMRCRIKSWSYLQKSSTGTETKWKSPTLDPSFYRQEQRVRRWGWNEHGLESSQGRADLTLVKTHRLWSVSDSFPAREGQSHEQSSEEAGGQELALAIFPFICSSSL